jgi:hypothetical protein
MMQICGDGLIRHDFFFDYYFSLFWACHEICSHCAIAAWQISRQTLMNVLLYAAGLHPRLLTCHPAGVRRAVLGLS